MKESSTKSSLATASGTALIVEDDPRLQRAMRRQLEGMGFHVLSASHYDAAVRHLAKRRPEFACIDVGLPSKSGYELCEHMRGALGLAGLPIIVTSEHGSPEELAHAEDAGGNAFLHKPFSMRQLGHCVESLVKSNRWSAPPKHELQQRRASKPKSTEYFTSQRSLSASMPRGRFRDLPICLQIESTRQRQPDGRYVGSGKNRSLATSRGTTYLLMANILAKGRAMMLRRSALFSFLGVMLFAPGLDAGNQVTWNIRVGAAGAPAVPIALPGALFKDHPLPIKGDRWHCLADKFLRQDESGNTFNTLVIHCTDGETTVTSSASCQIGANDSDKLSIGFVEKTTALRNVIDARCNG
jgi:CheY-like chemotaxis protein